MAVPDIFSASTFTFPYLYKFPGQGSDEKILYVTREDIVVHIFRQLLVVATAVFIFLTGYVTGSMVGALLGIGMTILIQVIASVVAAAFLIVGTWWVGVLWKKSIALITTKRLIKFIYTTPWNRHNLSLPLDMVVDTGAYSKGFLQAFFGLGTFTARSSASSSGVATDDPARINKKYFYIENVRNAEDIHHYIHKVLFAYRQDWKLLEKFRPFLPHLKGEARKEFMKQYPEYWS